MTVGPEQEVDVDEAESLRLQALRGNFVEAHSLDELIGVKPDDPWFGPRLVMFGARLRRGVQTKDADGRWSRYVVESFLQFHRIQPIATACYRLGMEKQSLEQTLAALDDQGLFVRNTQDFPEYVVGEEVFREIHRLLPSVRYDIFSDHSSYCSELHRAIHDDLGVDVRPVHCESSVALGDATPDFAYGRCCVSQKPIGLRYKVMLALGKPMRLAPDEVSLRFFLRNRGELGAFLFGPEPVVAPEDRVRLER